MSDHSSSGGPLRTNDDFGAGLTGQSNRILRRIVSIAVVLVVAYLVNRFGEKPNEDKAPVRPAAPVSSVPVGVDSNASDSNTDVSNAGNSSSGNSNARSKSNGESPQISSADGGATEAVPTISAPPDAASAGASTAGVDSTTGTKPDTPGSDVAANNKSRGLPPKTGPPATSGATPGATPAVVSAGRDDRIVVPNVSIKNLDGKVVYRGDIDLTDTLKRIDARKRLSFPHDGTVFQNREGRLPKKASGYYHEWVHPTPGLSGPGPQRVVTGETGEAFYTHDHYSTFKKIRDSRP